MLQHQHSVDVFHAVKTLRNNKPNMVDLLVRSVFRSQTLLRDLKIEKILLDFVVTSTEN